MSEQVKNTSPSRILSIYKGEVKPIPFRLWSSPTTPQDITGYEFSVRGKISLDEKNTAIELDNSNFTIVDAKNGLAYFVIPNELVLMLKSATYIMQITVKRPDGYIFKTPMFSVYILESV